MYDKNTISEVLDSKAAAMDHLTVSLEYMRKAMSTLDAAGLDGGHVLREVMHRHNSSSFFSSRSPESCLESYERVCGVTVWRGLNERLCIRQWMDRQQYREWVEKTEGRESPECTLEALQEKYTELLRDRNKIFARGVVETFRSLSREYRTNKAFCLGRKIIVRGFNSYYSNAIEVVQDMENAFYILDAKEPPKSFEDTIKGKAQAARIKSEDSIETEYFSIKTFKNQNGHVTFKRLDLVNKCNKLIADHYKNTVPDDTRD